MSTFRTGSVSIVFQIALKIIKIIIDPNLHPLTFSPDPNPYLNLKDSTTYLRTSGITNVHSLTALQPKPLCCNIIAFQDGVEWETVPV